ncbi:acyltransferase [Nocardioides psychrotolerans]|uniref:Peptidoglycan/LPS O-acetylase OafA/YrhL, contains acyltransferase and SGNH-hydrolase domains n=1 Tax=Nocardioides psychrotolerans TaxID=1005945 RepID=A0A1I3BGF7_9ACTN|nr:acyltransferase family protein [Nocardioides psychrotolerans]GEP36657.1 acyltransferase [Nocardioides psychrotolerans]SFH61230.1 Peptidoglycan/LPS O-acetylase OafA/YrhL, contains acyltransferase and SGNH-hydrolase domains [Nocardioides psychrotolerans]
MDQTSAPLQPRKPGFREDVQGLRAVAVLTVIAAHAGVAFFPGGYVGVDVFFVISGFLITQLLVTEASRSGRVSLSGFYARRARRILPAASVVLVATVAASVLWMSVLEAIDLAKDALWSAVFAANVRFAQQGVDYFSAEAAPSPLQHYWSLAVEEQFYLVWPLLVGAVVWVVARRRTTEGRSSRVLRALVVTIAVIGSASFVWSLVRTGAEPQSAYFSTFTRAWELAVGAGVALAVHAGRTLRHRRGAEVLVWGGLAAILAACLAFDETLAFPGYAAALPVLGTAAVLYAGAHADVTTSAGRLLSVRPMRVVGDWSYSLYLWHWPLLIVPPTALGRDLRPLEVVLLVALAFELAYLTHRFVEQPFRTRRISARPRRALILYPVFLGLVGSTAGAGWAWSDYRVSEHGDTPAITTSQFGITDDGPEALVQASVLAAQSRQATPSDLTPDLVDLEDDLADVGDCLYEGGTAWELCPQGDDNGDKTLVVIGDSHARAWIPAFDQIAARSGYRAFYLVKAQCSAALVDPSEAFTGDPWPECEEFHRWSEEQIGELDPELVVMTSSAPITGLYSEGRRLRSMDDIAGELGVGLADMFRAYAPLTERLVMLVDVPRLSLEPGVCLSTFGSDLGDCALPPDATGARMRDLTVDVATDAGIEVIDPETWFCADGLCPTVVGSTIAYRDRGHITSTRAAELAEPLGTALGIW